MDQKRKINMTITEGQAFFAHELSINFNPLQFILDFKSVTPRVDPRSKEQSIINLVHNVIMVDPHHAKELHTLLGTVLTNYEKEFGKIERPKALKHLEKKMNKQKKEKKIGEPTTRDTPTYLG